jgi:hypothetical protein
MDPRIQTQIRIHTKMSWIRNTATLDCQTAIINFWLHHMQVHAEDDEPMLEFEADSDPEQDNSEGRRSDDSVANVMLRLV